MVDATKGPPVTQPQYTVPDSDGAEGKGQVGKTGGTQPETGAGNVDVELTGVRFSHEDNQLVVQLHYDVHDLDDPPGPVNNANHESMNVFMTLDPEQGLDLIGIMGKATDELRHALQGIKSSVHKAHMETRQEQYDSAMDAADDEEKIGVNAAMWGGIEGVTQMTVGFASAGMAMKGADGTDQAARMSYQNKSQGIASAGGGIQSGLAGTEKYMESQFRARQQRSQADSQFYGSLSQDLTPQTIQDAINQVNQSYASEGDKVNQGFSIQIGNFHAS